MNFNKLYVVSVRQLSATLAAAWKYPNTLKARFNLEVKLRWSCSNLNEVLRVVAYWKHSFNFGRADMRIFVRFCIKSMTESCATAFCWMKESQEYSWFFDKASLEVILSLLQSCMISVFILSFWYQAWLIYLGSSKSRHRLCKHWNN